MNEGVSHACSRLAFLHGVWNFFKQTQTLLVVFGACMLLQCSVIFHPQSTWDAWKLTAARQIGVKRQWNAGGLCAQIFVNLIEIFGATTCAV